MAFNILKFAIVFAVPFVMFFIWAWIARRRAAAGQAPLQQTPWISLSIVGLGLMIATLFYIGIDKGGKKGGVYVPPKLVNGVIQPARVD